MSRMKGTYCVHAHPLCTRIDVDLCPRSLFLQDDAGNEDTNVLFVLELIEWNLTHNLTQASFTDVLTILRERLPHYFPGDTLPKSFNAAISQFQAFGLPHKIVDLCVNGCCRFDGSNAGCSTCPKCGADRWDEKMLAKPAKKVRAPGVGGGHASACKAHSYQRRHAIHVGCVNCPSRRMIRVHAYMCTVKVLKTRT